MQPPLQLDEGQGSTAVPLSLYPPLTDSSIEQVHKAKLRSFSRAEAAASNPSWWWVGVHTSSVSIFDYLSPLAVK